LTRKEKTLINERSHFSKRGGGNLSKSETRKAKRGPQENGGEGKKGKGANKGTVK